MSSSSPIASNNDSTSPSNSSSQVNAVSIVDDEEEIHFFVRWNSKDFDVSLPVLQTTVLDLKLFLLDATNVLPSKQKLLGLKGADGRLASDETLLSSLNLKTTTKVVMMGTPDQQISNMDSAVSEEDGNVMVIDDIGGIGPKGDESNIPIHQRPEYLSKIEARVKKYKFKQLNAPREGKKLLVLDIDYTIFDHRSTVERVSDLMRPHLHEFLSSVYPHYDIFIWSATSMHWIEMKMRELGVFSNPNFNICTLVDYGAMITIDSPKYGVFNAKPLQVIWDRYSEYYSPSNTIMFDDLGRNFIMNPQNGLKIAPFKNALQSKDTDDELIWLGQYLLLISKLDDFSKLKHKNWRSYLSKH